MMKMVKNYVTRSKRSYRCCVSFFIKKSETFQAENLSDVVLIFSKMF